MYCIFCLLSLDSLQSLTAYASFAVFHLSCFATSTFRCSLKQRFRVLWLPLPENRSHIIVSRNRVRHPGFPLHTWPGHTCCKIRDVEPELKFSTPASTSKIFGSCSRTICFIETKKHCNNGTTRLPHKLCPLNRNANFRLRLQHLKIFSSTTLCLKRIHTNTNEGQVFRWRSSERWQLWTF